MSEFKTNELVGSREYYKEKNEWLYERIKQLEDVIWAKDQLLIGYKTGKQPSEKAFNIIDKYNTLKALEI